VQYIEVRYEYSSGKIVPQWSKIVSVTKKTVQAKDLRLSYLAILAQGNLITRMFVTFIVTMYAYFSPVPKTDADSAFEQQAQKRSVSCTHSLFIGWSQFGVIRSQCESGQMVAKWWPN
jgi:hypothetical protein